MPREGFRNASESKRSAIAGRGTGYGRRRDGTGLEAWGGSSPAGLHVLRPCRSPRATPKRMTACEVRSVRPPYSPPNPAASTTRAPHHQAAQDVRTFADRNPGVDSPGIADARNELMDAGNAGTPYGSMGTCG
jgi:hypothetical protein